MATVEYRFNASTNYYGRDNFLTGRFSYYSGEAPTNNAYVKSAKMYFSNTHIENVYRNLLIRLNVDVDGSYIFNNELRNIGQSSGDNKAFTLNLNMSGVNWTGQLQSGNYYNIGMYSQVGSSGSTGSLLNVRASSYVSLIIVWENPMTACGPVTSLSVNTTLTEGNVTLSGSGAKVGTNNAITGYEVEYSDSSDNKTWGNWTPLAVAKTSATSFTLTVAPPGTRGNYRRWRARVQGAGGTSYYSAWKTSSNVVRRYAATTLALNKTALNAGESIKATLGVEHANLTHRLTMSFGSRAAVIQMAAGENSYLFEVALDWLDQIPRAVKGTAKCKLETMLNNAVIDTKEVSFEITCPASIVPSIGDLVAVPISDVVPADWEVFLKGKSKAQVSLIGAQAGEGASIASYSIVGGGFVGNAAQFTTGIINVSGNVGFEAVVYDTRGRSASERVTVYFYDYDAPQITGLIAQRVNAIGAPDTSGERIAGRANYSYTHIGDKNAAVLSVYVDDTPMITDAPLDAESITFAFTLDGVYGLTSSYVVRAVIKDSIGDTLVGAYVVVNTAMRIINVGAGINGGVAFGKMSETEKTVEIATAWRLLLGGMDLGEEITNMHTQITQANEDITAMHTEMDDELAALNEGKAPISHASKSNIYGPATTANWGHVTLGSDIPADSSASGSAGTANGDVANANHRHRYPAQLLNTTSDGIVARYALVASSTITTFRPVDAAMTNNLGASNYRYDTIYLKNNPNVASDARLKKDVAPIDEAIELIMGIEPVKFRRKEGEQNLHYGVIAQQVRDTVHGLGVNDSGLYSRDSIEEDIPNDKATEEQVRYGVYYSELIAPLIAVVQWQQKRIEALEVAINGQ